MGVSVGVEPFGDIFPRSSADLDQGLRARFRKSPRPPPPLPGDMEGWVGEDGVRCACGLESGIAVAVRAKDKSTTDLCKLT